MRALLRSLWSRARRLAGPGDFSLALFSAAPSGRLAIPMPVAPDPHRLQFRGSSEVAAPAVDAAAGTISRVSLITAGRAAVGHGLWVDDRTVATFHAVLAGRRIKAYATHGTSGADGTLDEVGYWEQATIDGPQLRANFVALTAWKKHDPAAFDTLFELAEKLPGEFGASLAFSFTAAWVLRDGSEVPTVRKWRANSSSRGETYFDPPAPAAALRAQPSVRATEVYSADFVGEPAANTGLFHSGPVDVPGSRDPAPISTMLTTKQIHERFSANPAHLGRALALSVGNEKFSLDDIAVALTREDETAEFKALRESHTKLTTEAAAFAQQVVEKDARIVSLEKTLGERDATIAAFRKPSTGGADPIPTGGANPEGAKSTGKLLTLAAFNALNASEKMAFSVAGGRIEG